MRFSGYEPQWDVGRAAAGWFPQRTEHEAAAWGSRRPASPRWRVGARLPTRPDGESYDSDGMAVTALEAGQVRRRLDPAALPFETTAEVPPLHGTIGQDRALDAIDFGLDIPTPGYNLFLAGAAGSGRESTILDCLERVAATRPAPDDLVYAHNFAEPGRPRAFPLPAGRGRELRRDLDQLLATAREEIPRAFEGEEFETRRQQALAEVQRRQEQINEEIQRAARERGFQIQQTQGGLASIPLRDGQPLDGPAIQRLSEEERAGLQRRAEELNELVGAAMRQLRRLGQEIGERTHEVARDMARAAVGPRLEALRERWADQPEVLALLDDIERDVPERLRDFGPAEEPGGPPQAVQAQAMQREQQLGRYGVNVVVDHGDDQHAPVVLERNPTYYNLIGRVDYRASFGAVETDFRQIRAGALHRARGGFLVLHALDVMGQPFAWEALKRALLDREVRIENLAEQSSPIPQATLRPEPVPLDVKVVLIGPPPLYHVLYEQDEDFRDVFKVKADFAPDMEWTDEHVSNYAAFVRRCVETDGLHHFDRSGIARIVEHGSRLREHQRKLSTRLRDIADVVSEASFWASRAGRDLVGAEDVDRAIAKREYRSSLVEERMHELIEDGTIAIETTGARTGQVNGLATLDLGDHRFGRPSRVTARVSVGTGGVQSIEREIARSGPIHSKGVLTLAGYLAQTYAQRWPLALRATLAFEQSYEGVDGDSASSTELYALLSALAELPIRQDVAVTGAVDQHGRVQAVGGVTAKTEGFFAICRARGLTGEQGVLIPHTNVRNLMLADEVVAAVAAGEFHVWAVETVDEGIELLTGSPAGARGAGGEFPEGSVHGRVEDRLRGYADRLRDFTVAVSPDGARAATAPHRAPMSD
jgi:lon-related putative ATP-dependent protease